MAAKKNTAEAVRQLAQPLANQLGLTLWDVRFLKEGADWYLRIYIDKDGGVSIDDCVDMTHAVSEPLDAQNLVQGPYTLEVSSPGINRQLSRPEHFAAMLSRQVRVRFIRPFEDGSREVIGVLSNFEGNTVTLQNTTGETMSFPLSDTAWVRLYDDEDWEGMKNE
ncbi:MAG: ribosome maturation factor RimP [Oscillospiraceae bacterium]|nr:ribosome maturation factor RimP [Oscillospiraceae bacterium]